MGATPDSLYLAVTLGTEQAGNLTYGGTSRVKPGDIFFDLNADLKWDFAIAAADQDNVTAGRAYKPKDEYIDEEWWMNPTDYTGSKPGRINETRVEEMFDLGAAFIYTNAITEDDDCYAGTTYYPYDHNVIELSIPWPELANSNFDIGSSIMMHFTQTCGNDIIEQMMEIDDAKTSQTQGGQSLMPEPSTFALLGAALVLVCTMRRRRKTEVPR